MNSQELAFIPALQQAQLIQRKQISPLELTKLYLERIEKIDSQLTSYYHIAADMALADAKAKTEQLMENSTELPPFFGVPISIKDLNPVNNLPCSYGVAALRDQPANLESGVVTKIKQAGFTILGKTATSQLGSLPYTEPPGFAPTRNPWNLNYTPGGSSGGAAAALAAGLCAISLGSDGGGSVRGPASCCGVVGLKPARGRITSAPVGDWLNGIATNGVLARTVEDAAAFLDVVSGYFTGDPYWLPAPERSFLSASQEKLPHLKIAFTTKLPPLGEAHPTCGKAVLETVKILENYGHKLEESCPDFNGLIDPFKVIWQAAVATFNIPPELLEPMNRWLLETGNSAGTYLQAVAQVQMISRGIVAFFDNVDILVLPVNLHPAIQIGEWAHLSPEETLQKITNWIAPCPPFNVSGLPAISVPAGFDENGVPVGVQLVGKPASEGTLLAVAAQLEKATSFHTKHPNL